MNFCATFCPLGRNDKTRCAKYRFKFFFSPRKLKVGKIRLLQHTRLTKKKKMELFCLSGTNDKLAMRTGTTVLKNIAQGSFKREG